MEKIEGEPSGGAGLPRPASLNLQGTKNQDAASGDVVPVVFVTPEMLAAIGQSLATGEALPAGFLQAAGPPEISPAGKVKSWGPKKYGLLLLTTGACLVSGICYSHHCQTHENHKHSEARNFSCQTKGDRRKSAPPAAESQCEPHGPLGNAESGNVDAGTAREDARPTGGSLGVSLPSAGVKAEIENLLAEIQQPPWLDEIRGMLAEIRSGVVGRPMGPPPVLANEMVKAGDFWDVTFNGFRTFHLRRTLGLEYLDYLLHRPCQSIRAFDLELAINPDKGQARDPNSIQKAVDSQTKREAREELQVLQAELEEAAAQGLIAKVNRLQGEIAKLMAVVGSNRLLDSDTGERARNNVRKAIDKVVKKLRKGGVAERAFAQHITQYVSLGYNIAYNPPEGCRWA